MHLNAERLSQLKALKDSAFVILDCDVRNEKIEERTDKYNVSYWILDTSVIPDHKMF